jgi:hypothetical protein
MLRRLKYWNSGLDLEAVQSYSDDLAQPGQSVTLPVVTIQPTLAVVPTASTVALVVLLSGEPTGGSITYRTVDGTALASRDYVSSTGTVTFAPGQRSATMSIGLLARSSIEDRTFRVEIQVGTGVAIGNGVCDVLLLSLGQSGDDTLTRMVFGPSLPDGISLSRSSDAWSRNAAGTWTQVASHAPRHHYTAPGVSGLLVEALAAEQRLYDSVDPGWVATGGTKGIPASSSAFSNEFNSEFAAGGTVDNGDVREYSSEFSSEFVVGDAQEYSHEFSSEFVIGIASNAPEIQTPTGTRYTLFRESATTEEHRLAVALTSANAEMPNGEFTLSLTIEPVNRRYFRLAVKGIDNIIRTAHVDLSGVGAVVLADTGVSVTIERDPFLTTWYRVAFSRSQTVTANVAAEITISIQDAVRNTVVAGATANGFNMCHVQIEPGSGLSSPILVTGASAKTIRAADILWASGTWFQSASYTLGMRFIRLRDTPNTQRIWLARDTAGAVTGVASVSNVLADDSVGATLLVTANVVGDGTQQSWTVAVPQTDLPLVPLVTVAGVLLATSAVTVVGQQVTLGSAPANGAAINIRIFGGTMEPVNYVGTGTQTVWTLPASVTGGSAALVVTLNGIVQPTAAYSVSGTQLAFAAAPSNASAIAVRRIGG